MTTIVGIFDNASDLDKAVGRLARAGFEDAVYDEAIVAGEPGSFSAVVFSPGYGPAVAWGSDEPSVRTKPGRHSVARAFKAHLANYHLSSEVIEGYATTFNHSEFVLVKTGAARAEQAMEIVRQCGAMRVNRHD
ncbi:MAG: hypothetical protein WAM53_08220 [Terrimicrobiaceae bacterium]